MSCKACSEFQNSTATSYIRWKNANIEVRACKEHLTEIFNLIREAQGVPPFSGEITGTKEDSSVNTHESL